MKVLVQANKLYKEYGDFSILRGIDFELKEGERVGLVGSNGAGKTTLAKLLTGELEETSGRITWFKKRASVLYLEQAAEYSDLKVNLSGGEKTRALLQKIFFTKRRLTHTR
ncbi:ATP-binding cassette domain-containing protein [Sporanaerobium hydrogeniformans]|uniref:ATP-binding cassette domain-containing protein n=1 Tax=Sporanaerobium hydrogeniformans TaxID=3072179 RepID=UPI0015D50E7F|nr:ATP-binding cassette domain-containing protein [Sporanaerobium hydrogeniformans]